MAHHMAAQPGSRIGAYEILGLLGAGGMGEVYRARDTRLQRDVAIKIIPDALANDAVARGRFETEGGTTLHRARGYLSDLRVSPDGNHVAFFEHPVRYDDRGFVKIWDRGGSVRNLAGEFWGMEGLAWRPDSQAVYFSAAAGTNGLYQVHEVATSAGSIARPVMPSPVDMLVLDVRRDGRWLVMSTENRFSIRVRRPGAVKEIDLPWMDAEWVPKLNADGSLVMFTDGNQSAGGNYAVSLRKTDGSPPLDPVVSRRPPNRDLRQREVKAGALFREGRCRRSTNTAHARRLHTARTVLAGRQRHGRPVTRRWRPSPLPKGWSAS